MYRVIDSYPASIDLIVGKGMAMVCKPNKVYISIYREIYRMHAPYTVYKFNLAIALHIAN